MNSALFATTGLTIIDGPRGKRLVTNGARTWLFNETTRPVGETYVACHAPYPNGDGTPRPRVEWDAEVVMATRKNGDPLRVSVIRTGPWADQPLTEEQIRQIQN
jgi:hypothetical protein